MSNLPSNSLQEGEHNLQEMKTKSPAWSSKGYHMYVIGINLEGKTRLITEEIWYLFSDIRQFILPKLLQICISVLCNSAIKCRFFFLTIPKI